VTTPAALAPEQAGFEQVAGHSASVAVWTAVSRITGFLRVATIAAILGPTFFGNLFQSTNLLPNVTYELLAGPLIASLLVPSLVRHIDGGDRRSTERVAGGFLGVLLTVFIPVSLILMIAGPFVVRLFTIGLDSALATDLQYGQGWLLLALVIPQLVLYGIAGTGAAVQNAHGRFALAAGAPVIENVGVIAALVASAVLFGTGMEIGEVSTAQVMVLGVGATIAVAMHAILQWVGAWRTGAVLWPRWGWRDEEVRQITRLALPTMGYASITGLRYLGMLVVASTIPGGVVAFTMAVNFFNLPVALSAKPVASALLPSISRLAFERRFRAFRDEFSHGLGLAYFVVAPAAVAYVALCGPLSSAVAFGEMATTEGVQLITASLAVVGLGMLGEASFLVALSAAYARRDARSPLRGAYMQAAIFVPGMAAALFLADGVWVLVVLGVSLTLAQLVSGWWLSHRVVADLPMGEARPGRALGRSFLAAAVMIVPAAVLAWGWRTPVGGGALETARVAASVGVGGLIYLAVQMWLGAPEPRQLLAGVRRKVATT
jgi:putative peptidoglycan lipid II flippase